MASFLGTLFGGQAEKEAAAKNQAALGQYMTTGKEALSTGLNQSTGALQTGVNSANAYQGQNYDLFGNLKNAGMGYLDQGKAGSLAALGQAGAAYDPLAGLGAKYGEGTDLYLKSLGIKGAQGNADATNAFQAGPGYQFTLDQGLNALNRRRAGAGMLASGNADIDALTYGTGLANQTYGGWQDRLAGLISPELAATQGAASGRAGVATNIANLNQQDALARLGLEQGVTQGQAGANTARGQNDVALGNALSGLYTGNAQNLTNLAGSNASGTMQNNNLIAQGQTSGAKNVLNAGMGFASLVAGMPGGIPGMGGSFGSLFGGGAPQAMSMGGSPYMMFGK